MRCTCCEEIGIIVTKECPLHEMVVPPCISFASRQTMGSSRPAME